MRHQAVLNHSKMVKSYETTPVCLSYHQDTQKMNPIPDLSLFLDAPSHLYKRSCPFVRPSARPSEGWSRVIFEGEKYAY